MTEWNGVIETLFNCSWCRKKIQRSKSRFCSEKCEKEEKKQLLLEFSPAMVEHERKRKRGFGITEDIECQSDQKKS